MLVNLNIVSARLSVKFTIKDRFFSLTIARAIPKIILKTTTCKTCPSATDFATFSGKICRIISSQLWEEVSGNFSWITSIFFVPTPACVILMAAKPIKSAKVVTKVN